MKEKKLFMAVFFQQWLFFRSLSLLFFCVYALRFEIFLFFFLFKQQIYLFSYGLYYFLSYSFICIFYLFLFWYFKMNFVFHFWTSNCVSQFFYIYDFSSVHLSACVKILLIYFFFRFFRFGFVVLCSFHLYFLCSACPFTRIMFSRVYYTPSHNISAMDGFFMFFYNFSNSLKKRREKKAPCIYIYIWVWKLVNGRAHSTTLTNTYAHTQRESVRETKGKNGVCAFLCMCNSVQMVWRIVEMRKTWEK